MGKTPAFRQRLQTAWFAPRLVAPAFWLIPLSLVFALLTALRRAAYATGLLRITRLPVPVVVVGNILVGGTGKTPLVIWLADSLRSAGRRPGIILRGYGRVGGDLTVRAVNAGSDVAESGDEALLLAQRTGVPVFVGANRIAAARALLEAHPETDVLISDDGLQHYAMARDVELVVFDRRGAGNGWLLPAGPLRESCRRLKRVDALLGQAEGESAWRPLAGATPAYATRLVRGDFYVLNNRQRTCKADAFAGKRVYAIAGTGSPQRFFDDLARMGVVAEMRAFPDHHVYTREQLRFADDGVLLMTEKDAVKCATLNLPEAWVLPVSAVVEDAGGSLLKRVVEKIDGRPTA